MDVETNEEDKAVILLNSLPVDEYEIFTLTLINGRKSLSYSEVSAALVSYEVKRQDKLSSSESTTAETLTVRDRSSNRKGRDDQGRSKSRSGYKNLKRNQCALCKELGHWKVDCPKVKGKKKELKTKVNFAQVVSTHPSTHRWMGQIQTHWYSLSLLLLLLLVTQIMLSGS